MMLKARRIMLHRRALVSGSISPIEGAEWERDVPLAIEVLSSTELETLKLDQQISFTAQTKHLYLYKVDYTDENASTISVSKLRCQQCDRDCLSHTEVIPPNCNCSDFNCCIRGLWQPGDSKLPLNQPVNRPL